MPSKSQEDRQVEANPLIAGANENESKDYDEIKLKEAHALSYSCPTKKRYSSLSIIQKSISICASLAVIIGVYFAYKQLVLIADQHKQNVLIQATSAITQKHFSDALTKVATAANYIKKGKYKHLEEILKSFYGRHIPDENTESLILDIYYIERYFHNLIDLSLIGLADEELVYIIIYKPAKDFILIYKDCWKHLNLPAPEKSNSIIILTDFISKLSGKYRKKYPHVEKGEGYGN